MLPNFIIAGGQKCGTTSTAAILAGHPDVFVPAMKEIHFFDNESKVSRGVEFYQRFFRGAGLKRVILDITPNYMYAPEVPQRIKSMAPGVKLIFLVRNPVDRAYSHYWNSVRLQAVNSDFETALENNPVYIEKGMYYKHLSRFLKIFQAEDILILRSEDLFNKPRIFIEKLSKFMDLDYHAFKTFQKRENVARLPRFPLIEKFFLSSNTIVRHARKLTPRGIKSFIKKLDERFNMKPFDYPLMNIATRKMLTDVFHGDVSALEELIQRDLNLLKP